MLTAETPEGQRLVIATPTKCGTTTLEEMARRHRGGRAGEPLDTFRIMDWEQPRRQHRMALPVDPRWKYARRYITVRNPFERYVSIFHYLSAPHNYSKYGAREIQRGDWRGTAKGRVGRAGSPLSFEEFLWWMVEERKDYGSRYWTGRRGDLGSSFAYRSPWVWLDPLDASARALGNQGEGGAEVGLIRLEDLFFDVGVALDSIGLGDVVSTRASIHANKCLRYTAPPSSSQWWQNTCAASCFSKGSGEFRGALYARECGDCAACYIGVVEEALAVGYA